MLLVFAVLGQSTFARFEIETPPGRKIVKWFTIIAVTLGLYEAVGHWALLAPVGIGAAGTTFHFIWCRRNGIDPIRGHSGAQVLRASRVAMADTLTHASRTSCGN